MRKHWFLASLLTCMATVASFADEEFVGRIDYEIDSGGQAWSYSLWLKGSLWRSELRSGKQLYELRIGDLETGEAFLVNEAGKSFRSIGAGRFGPRPEGRRSGGQGPGDKKKKEKQEDLSKVVSEKGDTMVLLERELRLEEVKGPGKRLALWWTEDLGEISGNALPRMKAFDEKEGLLARYFEERSGMPLLIEIPGAKGKNAFSMRAVKVEEEAVEDAFLVLGEDYKPEMGGRQMGGGGPGGGQRGGRGMGPPPGR